MKTPTSHSRFSKNTFLAALISASCILLPSSVYSDDLEIYTSITNDAGTDTPNHNIMFIMDTSGSMGTATAGLATGGSYDPAIEYGDPPSPAGIYVYDTNLNFTDVFVSFEQNACQSLVDVFNTATTYPIYPDQAVQWQQKQDPVCESTPVSGQTTSDSVQVDTQTQDIFTARPITPGAEYSISITQPDLDVIVYVSSYSSASGFNNSRVESSCYDDRITAGNSITCTGTAGANHDSLRFRVNSITGDTGQSGALNTIDYTVIIGAVTTEVCTPLIPQSEWQMGFINDSDSGTRLECFNDREDHGINAASSLVYVAECGNNTCNNPTYTSTEGNEINWSGDTKYFVPANYHDFLLSGGNVDLSGLLATSQDAATYCDGSGTINDVFIDTTSGLVFQCYTRLAIMQAAASNLVNSLSASPVNIGLMQFNEADDERITLHGGTVIDAVASIATNRTDFLAKLNALTADGLTPLSETLYEAYLYFTGGSVDNGRDCNSGECTDAAAATNDVYNSPITDSCQSNNIIFLTDGLPTGDTNTDTLIEAISGIGTCDGSGNGACLDDLAGALATLDLAPGTTTPGIDTVTTYTIGLNADFPLLEQTAQEGGGEYFVAGNLSDLQAAFQNIIIDILTDSSSFTAPAVSVNAFNELQHRDEVYYATFEPAGTPRWAGNVKKYIISPAGAITDSRPAPAINTATGFFADESKSFWSDVVDGRDVTLGGYTEQLTASRNIFTKNDSGVLIKLASNNFDSIPTGALKASDSDDRADILNWLLGSDVFNDDGDNTTTIAHFSADAVHSRPFVITYGGTESAPEDVLFVTTNLGTLHAIDPANNKGTEMWAYLPQEHQDNLVDYIRPSNTSQHTYGLDGALTVISTEAAGSTSSVFSLSSVKLYFGERRGGSRYYALDVSNARADLSNNATRPFIDLWRIKGALQGATASTASPNSADTGFSDLAQTWSKMVPTTLSYKDGTTTVNKKVFVFSGGYDPRHDTAGYTSTSTVSDYGNAIYIVDAASGALIYSIGNNDDDDDPNRDLDQHDLPLAMRNSIPSTPRVVDMNGDGSVDMIFAIDITGRVWRIDFDESQELDSSDFATGGMIFDLSSSVTTTDSTTNITTTNLRRFYHSIDVVRSDPSTGSDHLNLIVGSGYQARPSTEENFSNQLYILFDPFLSKRVLATGVAETQRYMYVENTNGIFSLATLSNLTQSTNDSPQTVFDSPNGIFTTFSGTGEKLLQSTTTFNGRVIFATYLTEGGVTAGSCGGSLGSGRAYSININNGLSVFLNDNDEIVEFITLERGGIAASPTIIFVSGAGAGGSGLAVCIGTECIDQLAESITKTNAGANNTSLKEYTRGSATRTFWREE